MPQPNMNQMMKQVQKMQKDMVAAQEALANETVTSSAGGGMVTVTVTGDLVVKDISIDPDAIAPEDPGLRAGMGLAAVNEAIRQAQELAATKMGGLTGGLDLGGLGLPPGLGPSFQWPVPWRGARAAACSPRRAAAPRASAPSPSAAGCRGSARARRSGWLFTPCAPPPRTRLRSRTRSARSR